MAVNFLEKVDLYVRRSSPSVLKRRARVVSWLSNVYKARRGGMADITADVSRHISQEVKQSSISSDVAIYRYAYLYLANPASHRKIGQMLIDQPEMGALAGVRALKEAGIEKWEQLKLEERGQAEARIPIITDLTKVKVPIGLMSATQAVIEAVGQLQKFSPQLGGLVETLVASSARLVDERVLLVEEIQTLRSEAETHRQDLNSLQERLQTLQDAIDQTHIDQLRRMAASHPDRPEIGKIAEDLERERAKQQETLLSIEPRLPHAYDWKKEGSGPVIYEKTFLNALTRLAEDEVTQVVKALKQLCECGPAYPALQSKRVVQEIIPYTPSRAMFSRAASDLRFTWQRAGAPVSVLTIYWLYRRGDSRIQQRER